MILSTEKTIENVKKQIPVLVNKYLDLEEEREKLTEKGNIKGLIKVLEEEREFFKLVSRRSKQIFSIYNRVSRKRKLDKDDLILINNLQKLIGFFNTIIDLLKDMIVSLSKGDYENFEKLIKMEIAEEKLYKSNRDEIKNLVEKFIKYKGKRDTKYNRLEVLLTFCGFKKTIVIMTLLGTLLASGIIYGRMKADYISGSGNIKTSEEIRDIEILNVLDWYAQRVKYRVNER